MKEKNEIDKDICLVCWSMADVRSDSSRDALRVSCRRCCGDGGFVISKRIKLLESIPSDKRDLLSHWIRKQCKKGKEVIILSDVLEDVLPKLTYPKPKEQANYLIQWLGEECDPPDRMITESLLCLTSIIGSRGQEGVRYVVDHLQDRGIVRYELDKNNVENAIKVGLTFDGWEKYEELKTKGGIINRAFLAMKYNDKKRENFYRTDLRKAIEQTGFELYILDDVLSAGLIDNQLRVEIRNSRFLLAELTDGNQGAYWEAGYAEGLGKPVIYLCKKDHKTHFDTDHCTTIFWEDHNLKEALRKLKATIRATLPAEAKMLDDG